MGQSFIASNDGGKKGYLINNELLIYNLSCFSLSTSLEIY